MFAAPRSPRSHICLVATLEAEEALPKLLQADRVGSEWEQLLASVHDAPASRGNAWWASIVPEMGADLSSAEEQASGNGKAPHELE